MAAANIIISQGGVATPAGQSNDQLAASSAVTLRNQDDAGVRNWRWTINDAPPGASVALTNSTSAVTMFTPDLPGTYTITLAVNGGQAVGETQRILCVVRQNIGGVSLPAISIRIPGAGEGDEANWPAAEGKGWHRDMYAIFNSLATTYDSLDQGLGGLGVTVHGNLLDLDVPADHTWAALVDGSRPITGDQTFERSVFLDQGGAMLRVGDNGGSPSVIISKSDGGEGRLDFRSNDVVRWRAGTNSGESFFLERFSSGGVSQGDALVINPTTGEVVFAGDVMASDDLTVGDGTGAANLLVDGADDSTKNIRFRSGGSDEWRIVSTGTTNNLEIRDDGGNDRLTIDQATGDVTIDQDLNVLGRVVGLHDWERSNYTQGLGGQREVFSSIAPFDGRLERVLVLGTTAGGSTVVDVLTGTGVGTSQEDQTETLSANTVGTFTFSNASHFSAGDPIRITVDPTAAPGTTRVVMEFQYQ